MREARLEIIAHLKIFEPTFYEQTSEYLEISDSTTAERLTYGIRQDYDFYQDHQNHFPIVIDADGSPWRDANLFLLDKLRSVNKVSSKTLESKASDLVMFRRWLDSEEIDYLKFPKRVMARPTYRYCAHLHDSIDNALIKFNTAKRRMGTVQLFYRWLINTKRYEFENPPWREKEIFISFKDHMGFSQSKRQVTTNLSFRESKSSPFDGEFIQDGGRLRPLPRDEQLALVRALRDIGNTEMTLAFMLSLTTGARMQTVFTVRVLHFEDDLPGGVNTFRLNTGRGTLVDTKYGSNTVLHIPAWLYRRIQIYIASKRAFQRRELSPHVHDVDYQQYVFLTRKGKPYYISDMDPFLSSHRHAPRGNSVSAFIRQQLTPMLRHQGRSFSLSFHDLRATFGVNYLEEQMKSFLNRNPTETGSMDTNTLWSALSEVQKRLGHKSIATTERYLQYKQRLHMDLCIQSDFEAHLMNITES